MTNLKIVLLVVVGLVILYIKYLQESNQDLKVELKEIQEVQIKTVKTYEANKILDEKIEEFTQELEVNKRDVVEANTKLKVEIAKRDTLDNELKNGTEISMSNKFGFNVLRYEQSEKFKAPSTIINRDNNVGTNEEATQELADMFVVEIGTIFNYNKTVSLLK